MTKEIAPFSFTFDDITDSSIVQFVTPYHLGIVQTEIMVNDLQFLARQNMCMSPLLADLVDIGIAVFEVDRLSKIHRKHSRRSFDIQLPLRHPDVFKKSKTFDLLCDILYYFTDDVWHFNFTQRSKLGRKAELQTRFCTEVNNVEVVLWSGGLDSLAGLFNRITTGTSPAYTLFGTGSHKMIQSVQKRLADYCQHIFPNTNIKLMQAPFYNRSLDNQTQQKNRYSRSRGFLFLLLGAVCACLEGQHTLHVYENGIGAINLPYLKSSTGIDHSRAVNPISLDYMSKLLSEILQTPFGFHNPFLFWTKANMCTLLIQDRQSDLIRKSITCDRLLREKTVQCGFCSSCLLRRQALLANGMQEKEEDYSITSNHCKSKKHIKPNGDFLYAMLYQVKILQQCLNSIAPWEAMVKEYPDLSRITWRLAQDTESERKLQYQLVNLYRQYVAEWDKPNVRQTLSEGLLNPEELRLIA